VEVEVAEGGGRELWCIIVSGRVVSCRGWYGMVWYGYGRV
jgi:hypothetical protein